MGTPAAAATELSHSYHRTETMDMKLLVPSELSVKTSQSIKTAVMATSVMVATCQVISNN